MNAAADWTKAGDLFDLAFLAATHEDRFSTDQVLRADNFSRDYEGLAGRFQQAFEEDALLRHMTTAADRALTFTIAIIEQLHRRGQSVVEQAIPSALSLADVLAHHKIWLESNGQEGGRANLTGTKFTKAVLCGVNLEGADLRRADFTGADLRNANLRNTDLREAVFANSDIRGADFRGADLTGFRFRKSMLGSTTKGFAEALMKVGKPDRKPYVVHVREPPRTAPERDFDPAR